MYLNGEILNDIVIPELLIIAVPIVRTLSGMFNVAAAVQFANA